MKTKHDKIVEILDYYLPLDKAGSGEFYPEQFIEKLATAIEQLDEPAVSEEEIKRVITEEMEEGAFGANVIDHFVPKLTKAILAKLKGE